jgi:hypothetical protein
LDQQKYNLAVSVEDGRRNEQYMNAVAIITNKVSGIVSSELQALAEDLYGMALFEATMTYLNTTYGGDSDITYVEIQRPLETCPKVKTIPEADLFVTLVSETDLDLGTLGSHRSLKEPYKRSLCLQKMGDLFNPLLQQISGGGRLISPLGRLRRSPWPSIK